MFDFLSTVVEAISGYLTSRYKMRLGAAFGLARIAFSFGVGLIFFIVFGLNEFFFPAPNPVGDIWLGLIVFSLAISIFIYVLLLLHIFFKGRKTKDRW